MAFTLDTFTTPALTMDSFKGQATNSKTPNERTAKMLAASQAAIEGGQVETYEDTKARLLDPEQQDVFTLKQQQTRDALWQQFVEPGMTDLLVDPNIPPEGKDQIVAAFDPTNVRMPLSTLSTLSYQAARADMDINATAAAEEASYKFIDSIDRVNNDKKKRQAAINSLGLMNDQGTMGTLVDVGELMAPFAEWLHIDHLQKELGSGDASWYETEEGFLLGEQKKALYERINSMSMDERADFTDRVLDVIQNNKQVVLSDGNDVVALETLNRMLVDNDYSNTERWFDNITSVLDVVGLGGIARGFKITKGIEAEVRLGHEADAFVAANKAEDLGPVAKEAEEFMARPAEDLGPIAREAEGFQPSDDLAGGLGADARAFTPAKEDLGQMGREAAGFKGTPDPTAEDLFGAMAETTRTQVSPTSASQIVKDVNPTTAREMHKAVLADTTGEVSEGLYGANKVESLAKDILPEPDTRAGKMQNKVEMKPTYDEPDAVRRARLSNGLTYVSEKEIGSLKKRLVSSFENVEGMAIHASSLVVRTNLDQTIGITARYSPVDSGFESWTDAVENAKFAFRKYGLQDDAFVPMVRRGEDWVEASAKDLEARAALQGAGAKFEDIDYAVGIKFDYRFRPEDLEVDEALTHTGGVLARIAQFADEATSDAFARLGQGSITQNVLDPASVISPQIVEAGHVAVDRATGLKKIYQNLVKDFAEGYAKLPKQRRQLMEDYIHEANLDGIPFSVTELYNRGFTAKEIEQLKEFRKSMDAMWYASNDDMVTSLRAKGVKVFTHEDSDTKLFGKPVSRNTVSERTVMYDAVKGTNVRNSKEELDNLYDVGGEVLRLDEPTQIDGQWVEHVLVRNTPSGGYTRGIYEGEVVMPYRDGYYPVMYDANYFIEKAIRMPDGTTKQKVIASAKDSKELAQAMKALRKAEPDSTFTSRKDRRLGEQGDIFDEGSWSHVTNAGMSSQKVRGERLGDAGTNLHKMGHNHLKDPLEAVANQIHNLSQRVSMRSYMETTKQRWMQNYAKHLDIKPNKFGQVEFPQSIGDIKGKETTPRRVLMDAKANFNYIHALQNGYINYIDETFKGLLHFGADMLGEIGWSKAQRGAFELAKGSPTRVAKQTAFKMLISLNPQRQVIVQRGQILQLAVPNPKYVTTGLAPDMSGIDFVRVGLSKNPKYVALLEEIKDAGILEAVDSHVLLRDRNMRLADMHWAQKVGKMVNAPIDFLERIGFAAAEQDVLISAYLTFRDLAVKAGKNIKDQRVRDEIMGQARAFTGGMNRAGDMAYSQNSLSMVAQFFSFRHKMLLQTVSNKSLTKTDRARLLAFNVALFGIDTALITYAVNKIFADSGKPSEGRDILNDGLIDVALNQALTMASGEEQAIDWGDLAPTEAYGMGNMFIGMWTTNLSDMIANSPAGSLWGGANPRVTDALRTAARYFSVIEDYEDPKLQTKLTDVATAFASLASGYSNTFKARYAAQMGKKMSTAGNISDADVTKWEAVAAGFGFQTKTEVGYRKTYEEIYGSDYAAGSDIEADVQSWYRELKRQLAKRGTTPLEDDMSMRVMSEAWRVFGEERPKAMDIIAKEIEKDARNKDYSMITTLTRKIGLATEEEMWAMINKLPDSGVRTQLTEIMNAREEMDSGN